MSETKNNISFYNEKIELNKLDWKQLKDMLNKWKFYKDEKEMDFNSLWKKLKKVIIILKNKPILFLEKTDLWPKFEKYIQEKTGFEQDITSKNFSKDALHKYFINFVKEDKQSVLKELLDINIRYNWQEYNLADVLFYRLYPDIVDYQVVVKWIKKEIDEFWKEIKK